MESTVLTFQSDKKVAGTVETEQAFLCSQILPFCPNLADE